MQRMNSSVVIPHFYGPSILPPNAADQALSHRLELVLICPRGGLQRIPGWVMKVGRVTTSTFMSPAVVESLQLQN